MTLANYHILIIKTLQATNTKPARVCIKSERFKQSVIMGFSNDADCVSPTIDTAVKYLVSKGFNLIGKGEGADHYYIISTTSKHFLPLVVLMLTIFKPLTYNLPYYL